MLNLSNHSISLHRSFHFIAATVLIDGFAGFMLWASCFSLIVKMIGSFILLAQLIFILDREYIHYQKKVLLFQKEQWIFRQGSHESRYTRHRIVLDAGIFFILDLCSETQHKRLLIFFDALSSNDYRFLNLLESIH